MMIETTIKDCCGEGEKEIMQIIKDGIETLGIEGAKNAQDTISNFTNSKGHSQGVDTGHFVNSIHSKPILDGKGFKISDGVDYGIYHEFGTIRHWVPFFDASGNITGLGVWALHTLDFESEVGKGGTRKSKEEILKQRGGMMVSLDEMAPFRKALEYVKSIVHQTFKEAFDESK